MNKFSSIMAESDRFLVLQNQTLDPKSLILSQYSDSSKPQFLQLTTDSFILERGPRYKEYSDLREKRKRMKNLTEQQTPEKVLQNRSVLTPPRKQMKFQGNSDFKTPPKRPKRSSILTQSVPDFSSVLRKENRKPASPLPPINEKSVTPQTGLLKSRRVYGNAGGCKSMGSAEKRSGGLMARKSYASIDELKGLAGVTGKAIDRETRGRTSARGIGKSFLG